MHRRAKRVPIPGAGSRMERHGTRSSLSQLGEPRPVDVRQLPRGRRREEPIPRRSGDRHPAHADRQAPHAGVRRVRSRGVWRALAKPGGRLDRRTRAPRRVVIPAAFCGSAPDCSRSLIGVDFSVGVRSDEEAVEGGQGWSALVVGAQSREAACEDRHPALCPRVRRRRACRCPATASRSHSGILRSPRHR